MKIKRAFVLLLSLALLSAALILPSGCAGASNMYVTFKTYEDFNRGKQIFFTNSEINVVSKYHDDYDFVMVMKMMGTNNIFNIYSPYKVDNVGDKPNSDLSGKSLLGVNLGDSDWFGPYIVSAVENKDGDRKINEFTGGNHDYLNGDGGSATGRTESVTLKVNGKDIEGDFEGYAEEIDINWTNYVQAQNTKKKDGSGREVLKEMYHIHYTGNNEWYVDQTIEFLETVVISEYYGMQSINSNWNGEVRYGAGGDWQDATKESQSKSDSENQMTLRKNDHYLQLNLDTTYGLGKRERMTSKASTGFIRIYGSGGGKTYYHLIQGNQKFEKGTIDGWKGCYKFSYGAELAETSSQS